MNKIDHQIQLECKMQIVVFGITYNFGDIVTTPYSQITKYCCRISFLPLLYGNGSFDLQKCTKAIRVIFGYDLLFDYEQMTFSNFLDLLLMDFLSHAWMSVNLQKVISSILQIALVELSKYIRYGIRSDMGFEDLELAILSLSMMEILIC